MKPFPSRPDAPPLAARGPRAVGVRTLNYLDASRGRALVVELWHPTRLAEGELEQTIYRGIPWHELNEPVSFSGRAVRDAALETERAPLIIYAHGAPGSRFQATRLCEHLASHGFCVAAIDFTEMTYGDRHDFAYVTGLTDRPHDLSFVLDSFSETLAEEIDLQNVGVLGYSFGGYAALAAAGAGLEFDHLLEPCEDRKESDISYLLKFRDMLEPVRGKQLGWQGDERIKSVFVMAPWNAPALDLAQVEVPVFVAVGEDDVVAPYSCDARRVFEQVSAEERHLLVFERGGHNLFTDPCLPETRLSAEAFRHCSDPVWDKERAGDIIHYAALGFFGAHLRAERANPGRLESLNELPGLLYNRS